jgi:Zn-dependent protease
MFFQYLFTDSQFFLWWIAIAVFSVCLHELLHALAAHYEGDDTAKQRGYFTLNPLVHMGPQSLVILLLTGMCWGLCPVNPRNFRHRYGDALVAFAGPFANLLLMVGFSLGSLGFAFAAQKGLISDVLLHNLVRFCAVASRANAAFFLLNMIPLPPLDGHTIVADFFPKVREGYARLGVSGYALIMLLFWLPVGFDRLFWGYAALLSAQCHLLLGNTLAWAIYR